LTSVTNTLQQAETASIQLIASPLMAYGRALHYAGQWQLAKDVFQNLSMRASATSDNELAVQASLRLGFVLRRLSDLEGSDEAYTAAGRIARRTRDKEGDLRATLGHAQNTIARGNLPGADDMLATVIKKAESANLPMVLSDALHDRAHLCHLRKDFGAAVRYGYAALEFSKDALSRDRILGDIAAAFAELGHLSAARDAHLIVAATTQEEWLRHQTLINLMEIAIREGHEPSFHSYRRLLSSAPLQPYMRAYYHLYAGQGYRAFGQPANAAAEFQEALELTAAHNLNQLGFMAEQELEQMDTPATPHVAPEWPNDLWEIASAIGEMRELTDTANKVGAA
jgi:tetratricopeptide (TPR) repeat protein